jgi:hypothetical protein
MSRLARSMLVLAGGSKCGPRGLAGWLARCHGWLWADAREGVLYLPPW